MFFLEWLLRNLLSILLRTLRFESKVWDPKLWKTRSPFSIAANDFQTVCWTGIIFGP